MAVQLLEANEGKRKILKRSRGPRRHSHFREEAVVTVALIADVETDRSTPRTADDGRPIEMAHQPVPVPIRLRRPPASEPPYDAAVPMEASIGSATAADGSRDVVGLGASAGTARAAGAVAARGNARTPGRSASDATAHERRSSPARPLPSPAAAAARYVRTCLEVLNGFRPAAHLRTLPGSVEFAAVVNQLSRRRNGRGHFPQAVTAPARNRPNIATPAVLTIPPHGMSPANVRRYDSTLPRNAPAYRDGSNAAQRNASGVAHPFRLQRMRQDEPRDGVAEVAAVRSEERRVGKEC